MARSGGVVSAAEFEEAKRACQREINQELQEAAWLMGELNRNLSHWAEKTGDVEKLAQVWSTFQNRLATVVSSLTSVTKLPDGPQN